MLFTVRYVDFGNFEERQQHQLVPLGSKFKLLPPRAVHCSIATAEHVTFTPVVSSWPRLSVFSCVLNILQECKKFNELTSQDGISIEVVSHTSSSLPLSLSPCVMVVFVSLASNGGGGTAAS